MENQLTTPTIENQLTDIELSAKLHAINAHQARQNTCFNWWKMSDPMSDPCLVWGDLEKDKSYTGTSTKLFSAFLVSELINIFLEKFDFSPNISHDITTNEFVASIWLGVRAIYKNVTFFQTRSSTIHGAIVELILKLHAEQLLSFKTHEKICHQPNI